jgi:hypothetical protein
MAPWSAWDERSPSPRTIRVWASSTYLRHHWIQKRNPNKHPKFTRAFYNHSRKNKVTNKKQRERCYPNANWFLRLLWYRLHRWCTKHNTTRYYNTTSSFLKICMPWPSFSTIPFLVQARWEVCLGSTCHHHQPCTHCWRTIRQSSVPPHCPNLFLPCLTCYIVGKRPLQPFLTSRGGNESDADMNTNIVKYECRVNVTRI